jgi:hypothetical protein
LECAEYVKIQKFIFFSEHVLLEWRVDSKIPPSRQRTNDIGTHHRPRRELTFSLWKKKQSICCSHTQ